MEVWKFAIQIIHILGAEHIDDCPMQPWIPKFLIIGGALTIGTVLFMCGFMGCAAMESGGCSTFFMILALLSGLVLFGWNIAGSVWTFKEWKHWDDVKDNPAKGCHNDTYLFAFALLIIYWVSIPCQMGGSSKARD